MDGRQLAAQVIEAASWRLACELMRRHGQRLRLIETHPGGGLYDCLALYDRRSQAHVLDLNRAGSAHAGNGRQMSDVWARCVAAEDPKQVVDEVERLAGLSPCTHLPVETAEVVTFRFVAEWLCGRVLGRERWECRNGMLDSSGYGGGPCEEFFCAFPALTTRRREVEDDDLLGRAEYRFWFLTRAGEPVVAMEATTGMAWTRAGECFQLFERFQRESRIAPLVALVGRPYLP